MKKRMLHVFDKVSVLALFLAVVIAVTCLLLPGEVTAAWDGTVAANFQSGAGTQGNPYIISTPAQLAKFLTGLNSTVTYEGQYFALNGNIDMTGGTWDVTDTTFSGTLDGRGYTITADCPFLGDIGAAGTVRGLNYVCTTDVSRSVLSVYNNGTVCGCVVKGNVSGGTTSGLICDQNYGTVQSCGGVGTLSAYGPKEYDAEAGMIAINSGTVKNCYAAVTVSASAPGKYDTAYSGPVVGKSSSGTVTDCVYDNTLYTYSVANATGLPTADMKNGGALVYLGSSMPTYCDWGSGTAFDGYPQLIHLAHSYTAYVSGYVGQELTVYNSNSLSIGFAKVNTNGTIYYSTDPSVTDPSKFTAYSSGTVTISGDTTVSMAVKYNNEFGAVTRQRFISLPGGGTESNPYKISEKYQLWLPELLPTGYFKLMNDLTFTDSDFASTGIYPGGWDPIASFTGTFDGQGHALSGLKGFKGGLFENIGNGGTVKNLRIIDHRLVGPYRLGAVADSNNGTVSHCYTKSAFTLSDLPSFGSSSQVATVGGVVGYSYGTVEYCRNDGIVYVTTTMGSSKPHIGGIVGDGGDIHHCVNTGDLIYGNDYSNNYADYVFMGGIAGHGRVENCKAVQNMYINDGTDYSPYVAGISAWYSTGYADSCVADFTLYKNATFGAGVGQYAYCANTSYKCYNAETAQLPADCEELTFGYGGNWWVSNEGVMPQGVIGPDGHAWVLKSGGQILPTCTAKGDACLECAICGEGSGSVDHLETISALGHRHTSYTSNNDATCQADGTKTAQCDRSCGAISTLTDEGSKTDCAFTVVSDTVATAATCKDAATYYAKCATCGTVSDTVTLPVGDPNPTAHTFENGICSRCMLPEGLLYVIENNAVTVTGYTGSLTELPIPASIEGKPVTAIGERAFENCTFTTVALPSGITAIGKHAFIACKNLTNITLPTTNLGDYLFFNCTSLQHVGLPANLQKIPKSMFYGCAALEDITIPAGVTEIGEGAFSSTGLKNVKIPENVIRIGANAFACCVQLQSVSIPSGVIAIEDGTFTYCPALVTVTGGSGITSVGEYAFNDCAALQNIPAFPNLKTVAAEAFTICPSLQEITLPAGVTSIAANAYDHLTEIYFGGTAQQWSALSSVPTADYVHYSAVSSDGHWKVKTVGATCAEDGYTCDTCDCGYERNKVTTETALGHTWVAADCDTPKTCSVCSATEGEALGHTWVAADCVTPKTCSVCSATTGEPDYTAHTFESGICTLCELPEGLTYTVAEDKVTVTGYTGSLTELSIPATIEGKPVTAIGSAAFRNRTGLTSVTIGNSVTAIGVEAFTGCTGLKSITIPNSVTTIGQSAFWGCSGLTSITIPDSITTIGDGVFRECTGLVSVTIPDGVTTVGNYAFSGCTGLTSAMIPDSMTSIGNGVFSGCSGLTDIMISDSITTIGEYAFSSCTRLTNVIIPGSVTTIDNYAFAYCTGLTSITIPDSVTKIGSYAFRNCEGLMSATIPDSVISMGDAAFEGCSIKKLIIAEGSKTVTSKMVVCENTLDEVVIPNSVTTIGDYAFRYCTSLTDIMIPDSITTIGDYAYYYCTGLTRATIPDSVTTIGASAFTNCTSLTDVTIPNSVTTIGAWAFGNCTGLTNVTISGSITTMNNSVFEGCTGLTKITIPDSVITIASEAFEYCTGLTSITIPDSVTTIGNNAFNGCSSLEDVYYGDTSAKWSGLSNRPSATYVHYSCTNTENHWKAISEDVTCTTDGYTYEKCDCGYERNKVITQTALGHTWVAADCDTPKTCSVCSATEGEALGHTWVDADCDTPKTCSACSATEGAALGHDWKDADCITPKTCKRCSTTEGEALGHSFSDATCTEPKICGTCNTREGLPLGHSWVAADCDTPKTCSVCSVTEGAALGHNFVGGTCSRCEEEDPNYVSFGIITQPESVTVPNGAAAETTVKAVGEGLTYTWYFTNNAADTTFSKSSTTTATYSTTMNADRDGRKVYCVITDVNGSSITTATVTLSMEKTPLVITQQPASVTVVNGATAKTTVKATGDGLKYTWYFTSGGSATKFSKSSATSATYSTTMNADRSGRQVYCVITDAYGRSVTSETATLYMKEAIKITAQPQNVKVPANQTATVTVEAEGEDLTYTWYYANKGKTTFTKSSYTTNTYSTIMDSTRDGRRVYCKITDKLGNSVKTVTVTMTMHTPLVITQQPANVMAAEGAKAATTVKAEGDGLKYAWYYTSGGSSTTFSKSSITTATYSTTMDTARDGRQVYCVITDKHGDSVTTNTVTLSMKPRTPLVITQQPANVSVGSGATAKTTVKAEGDGLKYTWYFTSGGTSTKFSKSSTTTASYSTTMDASRDGRKIYCVVADQYGNTVKSNTVTLSMEKTPLTITQQPADVTVAKGAKAATTVKATGDGLKYTWYFTSGGTSTKFSKSSITSATYSTTMDATRNGRRVYCVITDAYGRSVTTDTVTLSMAQSSTGTPLKIVTQPASVTVANGKTAKATVVAQGDGLTYEWYYTSNGTATKFYKSSTTTATYSTTMDSSRDGRQIYCVITDQYGNTVTTNTVTLKMS